MNKLTVLGGSAASVGTGQGCAGFLVEVGDTRIVLDLGPNTLLELRKHADFRALDAIVISHLHMDHVLDLFAMRFALAYNPIRPEKPTSLFLPPGGLAFMEKAADLWSAGAKGESGGFFTCYDMKEYDPAEPLSIGEATLTFAPTAHPIPCWAIRVHTPNDEDELFYTADTGSDGDLDAIAEGAAVIIADSAAMEDEAEAYRGVHLTARQAADLAARAGARHLVMAHQFEENDPAARVTEVRDVFTGRISVATPGTTVTW